MTKTRRTRSAYPTRPHRPGPTAQALATFADVLRRRIEADSDSFADSNPEETMNPHDIQTTAETEIASLACSYYWAWISPERYVAEMDEAARSCTSCPKSATAAADWLALPIETRMELATSAHTFCREEFTLEQLEAEYEAERSANPCP